jgi:hypothetical protein
MVPVDLRISSAPICQNRLHSVLTLLTKSAGRMSATPAALVLTLAVLVLAAAEIVLGSHGRDESSFRGATRPPPTARYSERR